MASQNIARLGVVLGLDTAEFTAQVDKAISENRKLKNAIKSDARSTSTWPASESRARLPE